MFFKPKTPPLPYDPATQTLLLRVSICTGERTLCARDKATGRLSDLCRVDDDRALAALLRPFGLQPAEVPKTY